MCVKARDKVGSSAAINTNNPAQQRSYSLSHSIILKYRHKPHYFTQNEASSLNPFPETKLETPSSKLQ